MHDLEIIKKGSFLLKSGKISDHYVDMRKAYGNPRLLDDLAEKLIEKIPSGTTCIACSGFGGISLGTILPSNTKLPLTLVRDIPKNHGDLKTIEGYQPSKKDRVVVVDDVFSSGTSIERTIENLKDSGVSISNLLVILKRGENNLPYDLVSLFTEEDLTNTL